MKTLKLSIFAIICLMLTAGASYAQLVEAYVGVRTDCVTSGGANDSTLYRVNPENAAAEPIGQVGYRGLTGLEFLQDGTLVGSASDDGEEGLRRAVLLNIDLQTGNGTLIGKIGDSFTDGECGRAPDLSLDRETNTLYATGDRCGSDYLQTVNQNTGQGTLIGTYAPFDGGGNGLAISDQGTFFVTASDVLISVNPENGMPTEIADIQIVIENDVDLYVSALAYHPLTGELYGTTSDVSDGPTERESKLIILNTETGATEIVGDLPDCTDGLVFRTLPTSVPTLSQWGMIAMAGVIGIVGVLFVVRRRATTS